MFDVALKEKYPFVTSFFEKGLKVNANKLSHSYLLTGSDPKAQYLLALNIARALNCLTPEKTDCNCVNCQWIKQNRHPAVITVSPVDFIHVNKDGKPKTVITVDQARFIRKELMTSSQYHRVIIFTDAKEGVENLKDDGLEIPPPVVGDEEERVWTPFPLNRFIMDEEPANTLLKTIEEPNDNIMFFFLTNDKENVIETIASRCQIINLAETNHKSKDVSILAAVSNDLLPNNELEAVLLSESLQQIVKEQELSYNDLLDTIQEYFKQMMIVNSDNLKLVKKITKLIGEIEATKFQIKGYVNVESSLETMCLNFIAIN